MLEQQEIARTESSCYTKFLFALNSTSTKRQYPKRFEVFLDFLKIDGDSISEKAIRLYHMIQVKDKEWLEDKLIEYFVFHNGRAENGEISVNTIRNYLKPIKLFFEMNGILVNWKIISKGIKKGNKASSDRPPLLSEIQKLLEFSDLRVKAIVSTMISSGIRVGSWDYLKWKHVKPIIKNNILVAAKLEVYNTQTRRWYYSFITPEAYQYLKSYIEFRQNFGEKITGESWLMRDTWQIKSQTIGKNLLGHAETPKQFKSSGIRMMINKAWKIQGVRFEKTENNGTRFEFKSLHGFRKFFETECQKVMKPLNISYLMSHDTGITQHYFKPNQEELLDDYLKAIDLLTINEENRLSKQVLELTEKQKNNEFLINTKLNQRDEEIRQMIEREQVKDDVIANMSDQLLTISEKLKELENRLQ